MLILFSTTYLSTSDTESIGYSDWSIPPEGEEDELSITLQKKMKEIEDLKKDTPKEALAKVKEALAEIPTLLEKFSSSNPQIAAERKNRINEKYGTDLDMLREDLTARLEKDDLEQEIESIVKTQSTQKAYDLIERIKRYMMQKYSQETDKIKILNNTMTSLIELGAQPKKKLSINILQTPEISPKEAQRKRLEKELVARDKPPARLWLEEKTPFIDPKNSPWAGAPSQRPDEHSPFY